MKNFYRRGFCLLLLLVVILTGCTAANTNPTTAQTNSNDPTDISQGGEQMSENTTFYFAVGSIDEAAKTAKVLNGDGEVLTIQWDGDAPMVGTVNPFIKNGDVYTAQTIETSPAYGKTNAPGYPAFVNGRQKSLWTNKRYYVTKDTVFFVRYSDTQWRVFKGRDALISDCYANIYLYSELELDGLADVLKYAMVVGAYDDAGQWPAASKENTIFLDPNGEGWDSGDIDLS